MKAHPQLGPLELLLTRVPLDAPGAAAHYANCALAYAALLHTLHQHGAFPSSPWVRSCLKAMLAEFARTSSAAAPGDPDKAFVPTLFDPKE